MPSLPPFLGMFCDYFPCFQFHRYQVVIWIWNLNTWICSVCGVFFKVDVDFWWLFWWLFFVYFGLFIFPPQKFNIFKNRTYPQIQLWEQLIIFPLYLMVIFLTVVFQSETKYHIKFYYFHNATCDINIIEPLPLLPCLSVLSGKHLILTLACPTCVYYSAAYWYEAVCVKLILTWEISVIFCY